MSPFEDQWARCEPFIQSALDAGYGTHTIADVRAAIAAGDAVFWPGRRCAAVTEFLTFPRKKALNFWLLGGDGRELVRHLRPVIEAWGRSQDCTLFLGLGTRPSWGRALKRHGYEPGWQYFVKDIG